MIYRIDEAHRIASESDHKPTIILSGNHPVYDPAQPLPIGEAEAMDYYLRVTKHLLPTQADIILESRARNTRETCVHVLPDLEALALKKGAPLGIILVSSPYHMRRFYLMMSRWLREYPLVVGSISCATSTATFDLGLLTDPSSDKAVAERRTYGLGVYLQEYFKLIGGRAAGEF